MELNLSYDPSVTVLILKGKKNQKLFNNIIISSRPLIVNMNLHANMALPAVFCVLLVALCVEDATGGVCVELRAALRVRPPAGASALPLTS